MKSNVFVLLRNGIREALSLLFRLREKIHDKYFWSKEDIQEVQQSFLFLKKNFQKNSFPIELFWREAFFPQQIRRFKRGFHTKSVIFQTTINQQTKIWVLKIGHRISPVIDLGDPSNYSYFLGYKNDLALLQTYCSQHPLLYALIPKPQSCFWMGEKGKPGKILILQPFVEIHPLEKTLKRLSIPEKKLLQKELKEIQKFKDFLVTKHKKQFDFLGEDNLVLIRENNQYHFSLLDLGLINLNTPLPLTQFVMQLSYDMIIIKLQSVLN